MVKYITKYVKDHYDVVKLRRDVADRLREFAKNMNLPISDAVSYLLTNINVNIVNNINIVDKISSDVASYVLNSFGSDKIKLIPYQGGDYHIFDDLNRIFMMARAEIFVEAFGGSCWCSLNVSRSKFKVIVCNDIDQDIIMFYRLVKDRSYELIKMLSILPLSREIYEIAKEIVNSGSVDQVTKAVMLFYVVRTSFSGVIGNKIGFRVSRTVNEANRFANAIAAISEYAKRFRDVVLESKDFREIIKLYDSEKTLFYLDPPYVGGERHRYYRFSFTANDLRSLANMLNSIKGLWVLKIAEDNYRLVNGALPNHETVELKTLLRSANVKDDKRIEYRYILAHNIHNINKTLY